MDHEIKGEGNSINYTFRMHDPRVGRLFTNDPLANSFPWNSPYAFSENRVIDKIELEGLETFDPDAKPIGINYLYDSTIPAGFKIDGHNQAIHGFTVTPIYDYEGNIQYYLAGKESGLITKSFRYDWVIAPESLDSFRENTSDYSWRTFWINTGQAIGGRLDGNVFQAYKDVMSDPLNWVAGAHIGVSLYGPTASLRQVAMDKRATLNKPNHAGNIAVFEYVDNTGANVTEAFSTIQNSSKHAERIGLETLAERGVDLKNIKRIYSELEPCSLEGHNCNNLIKEKAPNARVYSDYQYTDKKVRKASVEARQKKLDKKFKGKNGG